MTHLTRISGITALSAVATLIMATTASAGTDASVLEKISTVDEAPVNYTLVGKSRAESGFKEAMLSSAINAQSRPEQSGFKHSYKIRYQIPTGTVPTRSEFRGDMLKSATKNQSKQGEFSRFLLIEE